MIKCSTILDFETLIQLEKFMKINKIKSKSKAIKMCIGLATENDCSKNFDEIFSILKKITTTTNKSKRLIDQMFANINFSKNEDPEQDIYLKEFYENYYKKVNFMID